VPGKSLWILGHGGFLGSALAREASLIGYRVFTKVPVPWGDETERLSTLVSLATDFAEFAKGSVIRIIWAAGSQGVADSQPGVSAELDSFRDFVTAISGVQALQGARVTVVSSAGGVYSGSSAPPFTALSPVMAINQYGRNKIAVEEVAVGQLSTGFRLHIARVTNLYGPWPGPRQGLINRLCTAAATREALQIYVPLDTVRDYIYVGDAAQLILFELNRVADSEGSKLGSVSLIGSGENTSIGSAIATVSNVTRRKVPVTMAVLDSTHLQPRDLRMHPTWMDVEGDQAASRFEPMTLSVGVKKLFDSLVTVPRWN